MKHGSYYQAFISYSHSEDGERAPRLQLALHKIGKPWFRRRAVHVFRDETNVPASAELWPEISRAMQQSEYLVLMASPGSASSVWVGREIDWWLENKSPSTILIVVTGGEIQWDEKTHDFDWTKTTAVHLNLRGKLPFEPLYIDLRWAERSDDLQLRNAKFRVAAIRLAARLHDKSPDEMGGEDVRIYRLNLFWAWAAVLLISVTAAGAVWQAMVANHRRQEAERERNIAMSRQLAAQSAAIPGQGLGYDLGALLAVASYQFAHTVEAKGSLLAAFQREPRLEAFLRGHDRWVTIHNDIYNAALLSYTDGRVPTRRHRHEKAGNCQS